MCTHRLLNVVVVLALAATAEASTMREMLKDFYQDAERCGKSFSAEEAEKKAGRVLRFYKGAELHQALGKKFKEAAPDLAAASDFKGRLSSTVLQLLTDFYGDEEEESWNVREFFQR